MLAPYRSLELAARYETLANSTRHGFSIQQFRTLANSYSVLAPTC
jgi:hypothetical protein